MTDLIERAARRLCIEDGVDPDLPCPGLGRIIPVGETWPAWRVRERMVRAVLEEIREPTEAMVDAGWGTRNDDPHGCWRSMINAALEEKKG